MSLIREGAGYWRYIPTGPGLRFLTWYDYRTPFGRFGQLLDWVFRPTMGWATAWSFDRMRLWAEDDVPPELSLCAAVVHTLCRVAISFVWMWHGLVPKLMFRDPDELAMLLQAGGSVHWLPWIGWAEVLLGLLTLLLWRWRGMFLLHAVLMVAALLAVFVRSPQYVTHAFNPVTLNVCVAVLAVIGWMAARWSPSAARCLRQKPMEDAQG